jgi:hypothetical protein
MRRSFEDYLSAFEQEVIVEGILRGILGQIGDIPVKPTRLAETSFGSKLGIQFPAETVCAIDYYGYFKKSSSLMNLSNESSRTSHRGIVVHFASVRTQHVIKLAPMLVSQFPDFKDEVLKLRGFK